MCYPDVYTTNDMSQQLVVGITLGVAMGIILSFTIFYLVLLLR